MFKEIGPNNRILGIYQPESRFADEDGFRTDVLAAARRLGVSNVRGLGGNSISGYRWLDGVGPKSDRPVRHDLAWGTFEENQVGTNEFIQFCRKIEAAPHLVVNCGDGDMREAGDWVEYCNGNGSSLPARLRQKHGFKDPHKVKYWGVGNEVDGHFQIGYKTAEEYARAFTEYGKVMKWVDPDIKLVASAVCVWSGDWVERGQLLFEHGGDLIDYMSLHWYVSNSKDDFSEFMTLSELFERRLSAYEGLIRAACLERRIRRSIPIAVDEWAVRRQPSPGVDDLQKLEDALVVAMNLNAFIRHAHSVKMANYSGLTRRLTLPHPDGLLLQASFYPFKLFSRYCGNQALDVFWDGDTFSAGEYTGVRTLDVSATLDAGKKRLTVFVVNRSEKKAIETDIALAVGRFSGSVQASVFNGPDIKAENTIDVPDRVVTRESSHRTSGKSFTYSFEPHSVTALVCTLG